MILNGVSSLRTKPILPSRRTIISRYRSIEEVKPLNSLGQRLNKECQHFGISETMTREDQYIESSNNSSFKSNRDFKPTVCLSASIHTDPKFINLVHSYGPAVFAVYLTISNQVRLNEGEPVTADDLNGLAIMASVKPELFEEVAGELVRIGYLAGSVGEGFLSSEVLEDLERLYKKREAGRRGRQSQLESKNNFQQIKILKKDTTTEPQGTPRVPQGFPLRKPETETETELELERSKIKNNCQAEGKAETKPEKPPRPDPLAGKIQSKKYPSLWFSEDEREKLLKHWQSHDLDEDDFSQGLEILQAYAENNQKKFAKYKSHYLVMKGWVFDRVLDRRRRMLDLQRSEAYAEKAGVR